MRADIPVQLQLGSLGSLRNYPWSARCSVQHPELHCGGGGHINNEVGTCVGAMVAREVRSIVRRVRPSCSSRLGGPLNDIMGDVAN